MNHYCCDVVPNQKGTGLAYSCSGDQMIHCTDSGSNLACSSSSSGCTVPGSPLYPDHLFYSPSLFPYDMNGTLGTDGLYHFTVYYTLSILVPYGSELLSVDLTLKP